MNTAAINVPMVPDGGRLNILAFIPLAHQHRADRLSLDQRKKINRLVRLAKNQGGLRCARGYVVPCFYCAWWLPLFRATIEHLVNRRDGGGSRQENLVLTCYRCNNVRNDRELKSLRPFGLEKWVRRRLRNFRMDASHERMLAIIPRPGGRLRLEPLRLPDRPDRTERARLAAERSEES